MTARRVTKHFLTMVLIAAAMLAIVFSFDSAQVFAENKPLQRGQIYRLGTCAEPGDGYGQNADYKVLTDGDIFPYNGEYIAFSETGKGYLIHGYDSDEPSYIGANVQFTYITKYRNYGGQPGDGAWGSQHDYYTDNPGGYYSNIKYSDSKYYRFVIMPRRTYRLPDTAGWAGEDQGEPWALQITRGDGTRDNPYRFQVLLEEPYKIDIKVGEHGTADVRAGAPVGDKVKIEGISPDEGYELDKIVMRKGDGTETEIQPEAEGDYESYFFTMPEEDVSIEVSFKEKDGAISVIGTDGSAEHFDSLEKALSGWKDGTTLKVNYNVTLNGPVTVTDSRTLDLNGYVVKTEGKAFIVKDGGSLTVKDSKPTRRNRLEGTDYIGGHILGSDRKSVV